MSLFIEQKYSEVSEIPGPATTSAGHDTT